MSEFGVFLVRIFPYSDQENSEYGNFSRSETSSRISLEKDACIHYCYYSYYCEFNLNLFEFLWNYHYYNYKSLTVWKMFIFGVIVVCIFPHSDWIRRHTEYLSVFCSNAAKYGPKEKRKISEYGKFSRSECCGFQEVFPYQLNQQSIKITFSENTINFEIWFNLCRKADDFLTFFMEKQAKAKSTSITINSKHYCFAR